MPLPPELRDRARKVCALLVDVDGTLTDGSVTVDADGREALTFNRRDGMGFDRWRAQPPPEKRGRAVHRRRRPPQTETPLPTGHFMTGY